MIRLKAATIAIALGMMVALASPASAAKITHEGTAIILAEVSPALDLAGEKERVELVTTSAQTGEMTTTNAVAIAAPAPAALAVFGIGLLGLAAARRLRRR